VKIKSNTHATRNNTTQHNATQATSSKVPKTVRDKIIALIKDGGNKAMSRSATKAGLKQTYAFTNTNAINKALKSAAEETVCILAQSGESFVVNENILAGKQRPIPFARASPLS